MKRSKRFIFSILFVSTLLSGCSVEGNNNEEVISPMEENQNVEGNENSEKNNALVIYFSATGHTKEVANIIANHISSPIYELEPVDPYTSEDLNYMDSNSRVSQERDNPDYITELVNIDFEEYSESNYIFLGAPIWWDKISLVINDFVLSNDFTGKTIIPFATSFSSNFSVSDIEWLSEEAIWFEGRRFRQSEISIENVESWIDSLGINF